MAYAWAPHVQTYCATPQPAMLQQPIVTRSPVVRAAVFPGCRRAVDARSTASALSASHTVPAAVVCARSNLPRPPPRPPPRSVTTSKPLCPQTAAELQRLLVDEQELKQLVQEIYDFSSSNSILHCASLPMVLGRVTQKLHLEEFADADVRRYLQRVGVTSGTLGINAKVFRMLCFNLMAMRLNEHKPTPLSRQMFTGRRKGQPSLYYDILEELGSGQFGVISKVKCKHSYAMRAMKTISRLSAMSEGMPFDQVMQEISRLKALDHSSILRLFEFFVDDDALYLITDFLPGGDLLKVLVDKLLNRDPPSEEWLQPLCCQVFRAIAYVHAKGVIHRDLKLDNIMLCSSQPPVAVVIDVGLATLITNVTEDFSGNFPTMAPEAFIGKQSVKYDVWSLGCCVYGLLCRKPTAFRKPNGSLEVYPYPFLPPMADTVEEIQAFVDRQAGGPDLTNSRASPEGKELMLQMLTMSAEQRPQMRQLLSHRWFRVKTSVGLSRRQAHALGLFGRSNALEQAVLHSTASQLPVEELQDLAQLFEALETAEGDGTLTEGALRTAMVRGGLEEAAAAKGARQLALPGPVEFSRFVAALLLSDRALLQRHLQDAFNRLDVDGKGLVTKTDLQRLLEQTEEESLGDSDSGAVSTAASTAAGTMFRAMVRSSQVVQGIDLDNLKSYFGTDEGSRRGSFV